MVYDELEMGWAWNMKGVGFKGWYN